MKITCIQSALLRAMNKTRGAVPSRTTLPILTNFLLKAEDGRATLTGYDLDTAVTTEFAASVEQPGIVTLPARMAYDFLRTLHDEVIELSDEPDDVDGRILTVRVSGARTTTHFNYADPTDYPPLRTVEDAEVSATIDPAMLRDGIAKVLPAVATEDSRPALGAMCVELGLSDLTLAAADGFRLAIFEGSVLSFTSESNEDDGAVTLLIPRRTMMLIEQLLGGCDAPVSVAASDKQAVFEVGDVEVLSSVVPGQFPHYRQLVPQSWGSRAVVSKELLQSAVRTMSTFSVGAGGGVRLFTEAAQDQSATMRLTAGPSSRDGDYQGFGSGEVPIELEGKDGRIAIATAYLNDALDTLDGEVAFEFSASTSPAVFRQAQDPDGHSYMHIIMPQVVSNWE